MVIVLILRVEEKGSLRHVSLHFFSANSKSLYMSRSISINCYFITLVHSFLLLGMSRLFCCCLLVPFCAEHCEWCTVWNLDCIIFHKCCSALFLQLVNLLLGPFGSFSCFLSLWRWVWISFEPSSMAEYFIPNAWPLCHLNWAPTMFSKVSTVSYTAAALSLASWSLALSLGQKQLSPLQIRSEK